MADEPTPLHPDLIDSERIVAEDIVRHFVENGVGGEKPWEPFLVHVRRGTDEIERGIWLQAHSVPPYVALRLEQKRPEPQPPVVDIAGADGETVRNEENPNDATYQREHLEWEAALKLDQQQAILSVAIEVLWADEGFDMPGDPGWAEALTVAGFEIGAVGTHQRQVDYLLYYALASVMDLGKAVHRGLLMVGTPELEVAAAAAAAFRHPPGRPTDKRAPTQAG
jgi:hypothetical protein